MSAKLTTAQERSCGKTARSALDVESAQSLAYAIAFSQELTAENALLRQQVSNSAQLDQSVPVLTQRELVGPQNRKKDEAARSALAFENAQPLTSLADPHDELTAVNKHQPVLTLQHPISPHLSSTRKNWKQLKLLSLYGLLHTIATGSIPLQNQTYLW